jgi:tetratricopeptide (TPR) repeat protein
MPKELRAELHERFGRWLATNRSEYEEIVGYHFEQAVRLKGDLGRVDQDVETLAARAGDLLGRAGHRAYERGDTPAAVNLLTRATGLLPRSDGRRLEHLIELGYALQDAGELELATATFSSCSEEASAAADEGHELRARLGELFVGILVGIDFATPLASVKAQIARLEELHDAHGLAEGWFIAATLESWLGRSELGGHAYERAIEEARRAGSRRLAIHSVSDRLLLQAWGAAPPSEGLRECDELLVEHAGTSIEPLLRVVRALHLSFLGEHDEARREHELAERLFAQFGSELIWASSRMSTADAELRAGRFQAAEALARDGVERLERLGEQGYLSTTLGVLAETLCRAGRYEEAEECAQRIPELAAKDDFEPKFRWCAVRARVLARRGRLDEAEQLAREAVEIVRPTDWHTHRGQASAAFAEVLELARRPDEARAAYEEAIRYFERKGSLPDIEATRRRLAGVASPTP